MCPDLEELLLIQKQLTLSSTIQNMNFPGKDFPGKFIFWIVEDQLEINNYTKEMDTICQTYNLQQLIDIPTRVTSSTSSLIGLLYVAEPSYIAESGVFQLSISDHFGIYGVRKKQTNGSHNKQQDHVLVKFRDFKAFSEEKFLDDINSAPWQLLDFFEALMISLIFSIS